MNIEEILMKAGGAGALLLLLHLRLNRMENRIDKISDALNISRPSRRRLFRGVSVLALAASLMLAGCTTTTTTNPDGTNVRTTDVHATTNDVNAIIETRRLIEAVPR